MLYSIYINCEHSSFRICLIKNLVTKCKLLFCKGKVCNSYCSRHALMRHRTTYNMKQNIAKTDHIKNYISKWELFIRQRHCDVILFRKNNKYNIAQMQMK